MTTPVYRLKPLAEADTAPRRVTVLGITGSIGTQAAEVIAAHPGRFEVVAVTARHNAVLLAEQARKLGASRAVVAEERQYPVLKVALAGSGIEAAAGESAVEEAASMPADRVLAGITGAAGLRPALAAIRAGADIALANKECLVAAGALFMREVARQGVKLLPVDSEHSAIFQVLEEGRPEAVEKLVLTASGGPFRDWPQERMAGVTPAQAVHHPNWRMGEKISVDSATMMNKGLELIEAHYLFAMLPEKLEVLVHPESIVHSMVQYCDGAVLAQMGPPDMATPIAYALGWPERLMLSRPRLDLAALGQLTFTAPDETRFPCLRLAREALAAGGGAPTVLNAANEAAVAAFLEGKIGFLQVARVVEAVLNRQGWQAPTALEEVTALDSAARVLAQEACER